MTTLSKAAFAKHIGKNRAYVRQLEQMGRLVLAGDQVNVDETLALIEATKDPSKQGVVDRHQAEREQKQAGTEELKQPAPANYQSAKARREVANAEIAEIELLKLKGDLLPIADVKAVVASGDAIIRNRLESLPDVLSPQLAAIQDEQQIRSMLMDYVEQTLSDLSRGFREMTKRVNQ